VNKLKSLTRNRIILIIIILLLLAVGGFWLYNNRSISTYQALSASGTIEAIEVHIASEITGKVIEVMVDEGDSIKAGDPLFRLDDSMLQLQQKQAAAALETAKGALFLAQTNAEVAHANAEAQLLPVQQSLDDLYTNASVIKADSERAVAAANRAVREATYRLDNYLVPSNQQGMTATEAITVMKERLDKARAAFKPYENDPLTDPTREDLKDALDNAQSAYDSAVRRQELESTLEQAKANLQKASKNLEDVQNGPKAVDVAILKAKIAAIQATPKQADASVEQAKGNLNQVQSSLDLINYQLTKTAVTALNSGVVLSRGIEPGDVVQAGAAVMTVGQLDVLDLTVYVPEDLYGNVKLGEQAKVSVDSFPGKTFTATVSYISDKAEFTPRNVQTVEGRKTTVYAVRLTLSNPDLLLKPGMPADVVFGF
jgi:HlyD family secretion protein